MPENKQEWLVDGNKLKDHKEKNNLVEVKSAVQTLTLKTGLLASMEDYSVKDDSGTEVFSIKADQGQTRFNSPSGDLLLVIGVDARYSMINGNDTLIQLPHMYVYALKPFIDGTKASEFTVDDKPLYFWARVHKEGKAEFETCMAQSKGGEAGDTRDMFNSASLTTCPCKDGNLLIKRIAGQKGGGLAYAQGEEWKISVGPMVDPILLAAGIMVYEALKDR